MFSTEEIKQQLKTFEVAKGKIVTVHTSLKAVGEVAGRGEALLDTLIEFFTKDGGLFCVPTHTWDSTVCHMTEVKSCIGTFPHIALSHSGGIRSPHPTHSMKVFGDRKGAEEFVRDDEFSDSPTDPKGCYGKIYDNDGYVLLIGVGHNKNTYIHCVEEMLGVSRRYLKDKVERTLVLEDGSVQKRYLYWFDTSEIEDVSVFFSKFEPAFRYHGCIIDGYIGNAPAQLCNARKMKEVVELIYKNCNNAELLSDDAPIDERLYKFDCNIQ